MLQAIHVAYAAAQEKALLPKQLVQLTAWGDKPATAPPAQCQQEPGSLLISFTQPPQPDPWRSLVQWALPVPVFHLVESY